MKNKLITLALILLIIIVSCKSTDKTEENTTTTEPEAQKPSLRGFTLEEEYLLGKAAAVQLINQYQLLANQEVIDYLTAIGNTLVSASNRPATYHSYTFAVLATNEPLAFALPDGFIFVSAGLIKKIDNEDQLAAILALEIARITANDPIRFIREETVDKANKAFHATIERDGRKIPDTGQLTAVFTQIVAEILNLVTRGYPETSNLQTDKEALLILKNAGYAPYALLTLLSLDIPTYHSSRGNLEARVKYIQSQQEQTGIVKISAERTSRFLKYKVLVK